MNAQLAGLAALLVALVLIVLFFGAQQQADFYNCGPGPGGDDHIVACTPGTKLTGCEYIGEGKTTKEVIDCQ